MDRRVKPHLPAVIAFLALAAAASFTSAHAAPPAVDTLFWDTNGSVAALARVADTLYVGGNFSSIGMHTGRAFLLARGAALNPRVVPEVSGTSASVDASVSDGAGGWFIGGSFDQVGGQPRAGLAHFLGDGTVAAWNPGTNGRVNAMARDDSTLYVSGAFTQVGGTNRHYLAAIDIATGQVLGWNPAPDSTVSALVADQGTVYVGGAFAQIGGNARGGLAALDGTSGVARDWNPGPSANASVTALALQQGVLYVGGYFTLLGGQPRQYLGAVNAATGAVTDWNPGVMPDPYGPPAGIDVVATLVPADTVVYVGGYFAGVGGQERHSIGAVSTRSGLATAWRSLITYWYYPAPAVWAVAVDGPRVLLGGAFYGISGVRESNFTTVSRADGGDVLIAPGTDLAVKCIATDSTSLLVGGAFVQMNRTRTGLAAFDLRTRMPLPWNPNPNGPVNAIVALPGLGSIYVGGRFSIVGSYQHWNLARIDGASRAGGGFYDCPWTDGEVTALAFDGGSLYVAGAFYSLTDSTVWRNHLAEIEPTTGRLTPWNPGVDGHVRTLLVTPDDVLVGGNLWGAGGAVRNNLAAVSRTTGLATAWSPEPNDEVDALMLDGGALVLGGMFNHVGGALRHAIARVDLATGAPDGWAPESGAPVLALAKVGDVVVAGGAFQAIGEQVRGHIAALDPHTGLAQLWGPNLTGNVNVVLDGGPWLYVGGSFTTVDGVPRGGLAAIESASMILSVPATSPHATFELAPCAPNPARASTTLRFTLPARTRVSLEVYDLGGRRVATAVEPQFMAAGPHALTLRTAGWAPGLYLCRLQAGAQFASRKVVVVR